MKKDYKKEAMGVLVANGWTCDMIGKVFNAPGTNREKWRNKTIKTLPSDIKKQIEYLATYRKRTKSVIIERVKLIKKLREDFPFSCPEIGLLLRRNHSTIMHHYQSRID